MKESWYQEYQDAVGKTVINLPGNFSTSQNLSVALGFGCGELEPDYKSILYAISVKNYGG